MANWKDEEIRELLSVRADGDIVKQIQGTARDSIVYDQITRLLRDRGVKRTKAQINSKLKALKKQYRHIVENNNRTNDRKTWRYYSLCEAIWGSSPCTDTVASVGSMETASTCGSPKTPKSEPEEQIPVRETDVSGSDSVLSTESCRSPCTKRRKKPTRSERLTAEMMRLFAEMDKDFGERERLRWLEQREYEERVRREARAERAQEMAILQDLTSLLREMVRRMPAPRPPSPP